jgi:CDGSH-type Zn-finger protein
MSEQQANHLSGSPRTPADTVTIRCRENGPLVVEMPHETSQPGLKLQVTDHFGAAFTPPGGKRAIALCRCGHSGTRPFCDGSHRRHEFVAAEQAAHPSDDER